MTQYKFTAQGTQTLLNGKAFLVKGLRCSNALISDAATGELIGNLGLFAGYGVNTVSVYFMGNRFGDVVGYREDATLDPVYAARMGRIVEAADARAMVILVGCLYWGDSRARWEHWTQVEANAAVGNTVRWLADHDYHNVFVDVDNEGMALRGAGFDNRQMVLAGRAVDPSIAIATNFRGDPPPEADLAIHHSNVAPGKPYIETEGSPGDVPGGQGYWGPYSNLRDGSYTYVNIGLYTEAMRESQKALTRQHLDNGMGYMLASTWLQAPPPGPYQCPGGYGAPGDPGIRWWLEYLREAYGPHTKESL
jgi:hypothetical protein